nr:DUF1963 domain-containing protein [Neorhizobium tomejilense]
MPLLIRRVLNLKDNPAYPLHKERTVRYMVDRWSSPDGFELLDELCGLAGLSDSLFPEIPPVRLYGTDFGNPDILHVDIEWLGTDGVQMVIDYHKEAHARMVAERHRAIDEERARKAALYAPLSDVIKAYRSLRRTAWVPVTGSGPGADKASRYFGLPWMPDGETWPVNEAGVPLSFVMQVEIEALPTAARRYFGFEDIGIVALFYDLEADWNPDYEGSEDFERNAAVLFFDTTLPGGLRNGTAARDQGRQIASWRTVDDYPAIEDAVESAILPVNVQKMLIETGLRIGGTHYRNHGDVTSADDVRAFIRDCERIWGGDSCDAETAAEALDLFCGSGNKLGGWPSWDGGRRWPTSNGGRLGQFFQLDMMDADWNGFSFWRGDERGRIFINPTEKCELRLSWDGRFEV